MAESLHYEIIPTLEYLNHLSCWSKFNQPSYLILLQSNEIPHILVPSCKSRIVGWVHLCSNAHRFKLSTHTFQRQNNPAIWESHLYLSCLQTDFKLFILERWQIKGKKSLLFLPLSPFFFFWTSQCSKSKNVQKHFKQKKKKKSGGLFYKKECHTVNSEKCTGPTFIQPGVWILVL